MSGSSLDIEHVVRCTCKSTHITFVFARDGPVPIRFSHTLCLSGNQGTSVRKKDSKNELSLSHVNFINESKFIYEGGGGSNL